MIGKQSAIFNQKGDSCNFTNIVMKSKTKHKRKEKLPVFFLEDFYWCASKNFVTYFTNFHEIHI